MKMGLRKRLSVYLTLMADKISWSKLQKQQAVQVQQ